MTNIKKVRSEEEIHNFAKELILYEKAPLTSFGLGISPLADIGIAISYYKYLALIKQIRFAATSLTNSYKTQQIDIWGKESMYPIEERTMYLQDAFSYYNSCIDYIYVILYFYYDIDNLNNNIRNQEQVVKISENVKGSKLGERRTYLKKYHNDFYRFLDKYKKSREPINQKTIDIKHRAGFWVCSDGINVWGTATKRLDEKEVNLTEIVTPKVLDIEHEINELKVFHNETVELQIKLCELLNYPNQIRNKLNI